MFAGRIRPESILPSVCVCVLVRSPLIEDFRKLKLRQRRRCWRRWPSRFWNQQFNLIYVFRFSKTGWPRQEGDDYFTLHQRRQLPKTELGAIFGEDNPTHQDTRPDGARIVVVVVADDHQRFMISTFWKAIPALTSPCTDDAADLAICCAFWFWCFQKRGPLFATS